MAERDARQGAVLARATLTSKGQITVPSVVRRRLGVGPGDQIGFRADGRLLPLPRTTLSTLAGAMPPRSGRGRTLAELRDEIAEDVSAPTGSARTTRRA